MVVEELLFAARERGRGGEAQHHSQIFQISAGELFVGDDLDLAVTLLANEHRIAQVPGPIINFDLLV